MQAIAKITETGIGIILPTTEAFVPLLRARQSLIAQTPKKTFKYGLTDRHQLDVYYPPDGTARSPILFFLYGGGFVRGDRSIHPGLQYENIGSFFAQRQILTVIPDYRLAPATKYPDPVRDVRTAVQFALSSPEVTCAGDVERVYIMGHSAGGAHAATLFLNEDILEDRERETFKGAVLSCAAFENGPPGPPDEVYYGELAEDRTPLGLLKKKSSDKLKQALPPRLLFLTSEHEIPALVKWTDNFKRTLREKGMNNFEERILKEHNHLSPCFSLMSGDGEEWGEHLAEWINE